MRWTNDLAKYRSLNGGDYGSLSANLSSIATRFGTAGFAGAMQSDSMSSTVYGKYYDAFPSPDQVGDADKLVTPQSALDLAAAAAILDDVPDDTSTTATLEIGGARIFSTLSTIGDQDFYSVQLTAGVTYEFGMFSTTQGPSGVPLLDAYVEIYDANGNLVTFGDGGAPTKLNEINTGLDVLLYFTPETTGTYYVNARAFDEVPTDGDNGDSVGDYELFGRLSNYIPHYDLNSPLHSIDWGTQFDGTSRNPDGAEGPRPTGNEVESKIGGKNVIYVYFAKEGDIFVDGGANPLNLTTTMVAEGLEPWEKAAFNSVFAEYEKVADIDYVETDDRYAADIVVVTYEGTPGPGASLLGRMSPPDTPSEGQTEYNAGDERWTQEGLAPGGFYFGTLIHEFGHGHGMAHPHDNGGKSSVMQDENTESGYVEETTPLNYTLGTGNLNQSVYTMMSYMDGWQLSPYGQADSGDGYGFIGSLMALDIAVIQDKYGVNEEWATGNDTYTLKDVNETAQFDADGNITREATSYRSIWDAGGTDKIVYNGAKDANIDLRPATLRYEEGGGGWISYAWGIYGGFTIANGVTIENATSGSGNDTLIGNDVRNILTSNAGNDTLDGGGAADRMVGGTGNDIYIVENSRDEVVENAGEGSDTVRTSVDFQLVANVEKLVYTGTGPVNLTGNGLDNLVDGASATGRVVANGGAGNDQVYGGSAGDKLSGGAGNDKLFGNDGTDALYGGDGTDTLKGGLGGDTLFGDAGADTLDGEDGNDTLYGGAGADVLTGGLGADVFMFDGLAVDGSTDRINRFSAAEGDKVNLGQIDANAGLAGNQAFTFIGAAAFSGAAGELRLFIDASGKQVAAGDVNGDGLADFAIQFANSAAPVAPADFIL